jgi:hypothetical protein
MGANHDGNAGAAFFQAFFHVGREGGYSHRTALSHVSNLGDTTTQRTMRRVFIAAHCAQTEPNMNCC